MRLIPSTCFLIIPLHKAYILIIYLDLIRFSFSCVYVCIFFFSVKLTIADYIFYSSVFLTQICLFSCCMKALNIIFTKNVFREHRNYFVSRLVYWCMSFLKICFYTQKHCLKFNGDDGCLLEEYSSTLYIDLIFIMLDVYLFFVIYGFIDRLKNGRYGIFEGEPIFPEALAAINTGMFKEGIISETYGFRIKISNAPLEVQKGIVMNFGKNKNKNKLDYFKIFPIPLVKSHKSHQKKTSAKVFEIIDFTENTNMISNGKYGMNYL